MVRHGQTPQRFAGSDLVTEETEQQTITEKKRVVDISAKMVLRRSAGPEV